MTQREIQLGLDLGDDETLLLSTEDSIIFVSADSGEVLQQYIKH